MQSLKIITPKYQGIWLTSLFWGRPVLKYFMYHGNKYHGPMQILLTAAEGSFSYTFKCAKIKYGKCHLNINRYNY
jgi:hypothetical protein